MAFNLSLQFAVLKINVQDCMLGVAIAVGMTVCDPARIISAVRTEGS